MEKIIKSGDKVRFKESALKAAATDDYLDAAYLRNKNSEEIYTVSDINSDGNVFLEGQGGVVFNKRVFIRMCVDCQKERVFRDMDNFDRCMICASKHRDKMYEKFRVALPPDLLALFDEYRKAVEDFSSIMILD